MIELTSEHINYQRISKAIRFLVAEQRQQPTLLELSRHVGVSEYHLQRTFSQWAGVSPRQFLQYLTKENAKQLLRQHSVNASALACGLSGSSRLYDLLVSYESVTPGEYRSAGRGLELHYGIHSSPFGYCFIAISHRGICKLAFFDHQQQRHQLLAELQQEWPNALISSAPERTAATCKQIFSQPNSASPVLQLQLRGSPFQLKVWEALLKIPAGQLTSYQQLAASIAQPTASRAVASAVARNNIALLIPCHRVIRGTGALNNYRWGGSRKAAMIGRELTDKE
ncbi:DNA-O6-methylguanine--protein-cysteine S-methyltransferase /transcriptional regulator Ada [Sinobacterium caligoides]|uniref:DNA-O6-methylguanine--protein-cysteine S-methyltransferase /transcriptional regulator Ada n=1 Tax=Sinobacterium caligoides TaxID=933926 RepID=A0A3N2DQZ3_9GAMM|nr:methylated-DNA--[protein]-cysteine S-methyltransferase [Sinobacterium caligoides]ROS02019.1 DNA-O6-methylguanine--protein-cysteine S-methyltransferase /transcriptional regulator Ada [Sinobacterium caligoides]